MTPPHERFEHSRRYTNLVSLHTHMKRLTIGGDLVQRALENPLKKSRLPTLGSDVSFSSPGSGAGLEYSPDRRPYPSFALL